MTAVSSLRFTAEPNQSTAVVEASVGAACKELHLPTVGARAASGARIVEDFYSYDFLGFAEHWDGTRWTRVYGVDGSQLFDVEALGPGDAWSVGTRNIGTVIQHWNGERWRTVPSPDPGVGGWLRALEPGVDASTLWAAESWVDSSKERTLILQAPSMTQGSVRRRGARAVT